MSPITLYTLKMFSDGGATALCHLRSGMIETLCHGVLEAAASWWDGAGRDTGAGGYVPEATEDSSAASVRWRAAHSQDRRSAQQAQSGPIVLALFVSTRRGCGSELFSVRDTFPLQTRPRSDGRSTCGSPRRVLSMSAGVCSPQSRIVVQAQAAREDHEAAEAAESVTAALDRWQAAETSRRRAVEASKKVRRFSAQGATGV